MRKVIILVLCAFLTSCENEDVNSKNTTKDDGALVHEFIESVRENVDLGCDMEHSKWQNISESWMHFTASDDVLSKLCGFFESETKIEKFECEYLNVTTRCLFYDRHGKLYKMIGIILEKNKTSEKRKVSSVIMHKDLTEMAKWAKKLQDQ